MVTPSAQPAADRNRLYVSVVSDIEAQILSEHAPFRRGG